MKLHLQTFSINFIKNRSTKFYQILFKHYSIGSFLIEFSLKSISRIVELLRFFENETS